VDEAEIAKRMAEFKPVMREVSGGYLKRYRDMVTSANTGAVFRD
jgi:Dihydroxyacid dehydratase/phosphogluconate dehydratase